MNNTKQTVMDIAMNLNRIGNWVDDDYKRNEKKIQIFIENTNKYIDTVQDLDTKFKPTWVNFISAYNDIKNNLSDNAENLMTWGNILTHRSSLIAK